MQLFFCDASDYINAFGGFQFRLNDQPVSGMFTPFESQQSSTFRELKAMFYVIKAHVVSLRHKKVKVFTDNKNASRIVSIGSSKQHLQSLAINIFQLCLENDILIDAQWIPCGANSRADLLSRFVDKDDWSLNSEIFTQLDGIWGPHSVDRFASHYNAQVPRFNSKFMSPGCSAVDALSQDWRGQNNWLCPYFLEYLAGVVLRSPGVMSCCVHFAAIFVNSQVSVVYLKL